MRADCFSPALAVRPSTKALRSCDLCRLRTGSPDHDVCFDTAYRLKLRCDHGHSTKTPEGHLDNPDTAWRRFNARGDVRSHLPPPQFVLYYIAIPALINIFGLGLRDVLATESQENLRSKRIEDAAKLIGPRIPRKGKGQRARLVGIVRTDSTRRRSRKEG